MNVERFAGENEHLARFAAIMQNNENRMQSIQNEALENAYKQRARDIAATGVENPGRFL